MLKNFPASGSSFMWRSGRRERSYPEGLEPRPPSLLSTARRAGQLPLVTRPLLPVERRLVLLLLPVPLRYLRPAQYSFLHGGSGPRLASRSSVGEFATVNQSRRSPTPIGIGVPHTLKQVLLPRHSPGSRYTCSCASALPRGARASRASRAVPPPTDPVAIYQQIPWWGRAIPPRTDPRLDAVRRPTKR